MPSLAQRLRTETRTLHVAAERSRFMGAMLRGEMDRATYCVLLRNLQPIYAALEPALQRHAQHPLIAPIFQPALRRAPALVDDLTALHGPDWPTTLAVHPIAASYVSRLQVIDRAQPELLLAHAYVRYLGDLSGGQILRHIVAHSVPMPGGAGMSFYSFGDADETLALTHAFRSGLAGIVVERGVQDALVDEAMRAFEMHRSLFEALADECGIAQPQSS